MNQTIKFLSEISVDKLVVISCIEGVEFRSRKTFREHSICGEVTDQQTSTTAKQALIEQTNTLKS